MKVDSSSTLFTEIPSVDLNRFQNANLKDRVLFANELGKAFTQTGFCAVKNHGLSAEATESLYSSWKAFFDLKTDAKLFYDKPELAGQRGYTGKGKEHAKGRSIGDLKEFFQMGQINPKTDTKYPENLWPHEIQGIKESSEHVFKTLEETGITLLRAIALFLGLEEKYFDEKVKSGNSILRAIHYFPLENAMDFPEDAVRAAEHGDINLITLLMGASAEGLQVLRQDGEWIPITALPDHLVVNVGDMLERLTNGLLPSTLHRVVNPPKELLHMSRYSMPFFLHPKPEMDLSCLPQCITETHPKSFEDITAGEFLDKRLIEIGLKTKS